MDARGSSFFSNQVYGNAFGVKPTIGSRGADRQISGGRGLLGVEGPQRFSQTDLQYTYETRIFAAETSPQPWLVRRVAFRD